MKLSAVRFYNSKLWDWLYSYRVVLVTWRMGALGFTLLKYYLLKAPLLMAWTRLPVLRDRQPPFWKNLATVVAPLRDRPSLTTGGGQLGSNLVLTKSAEDVAKLRNTYLKHKEPPVRARSIAGSLLRGAMTELGPAFIKFGQIMSMREELPNALRDELQLLQDRVPPMKFKVVQQIIEDGLERPLDEVFEWVEETPIAAASLAQVHRGRLRKEQEDVAIKVQRENLEGIVGLDTVIICDIMLPFIRMLLPLFRKNTDPSVFTSSYRKSLKREIDFVLEGRSQTKCRELVSNHPNLKNIVKIARTYPQYTTQKVLTMELVKDYLRRDRIFDDLTPEEIWQFLSQRVEGLPAEVPLHSLIGLASLCAEGILHWGFWTGDVHAGNVYVLRPENPGDHWRTFLCDFGMMIDLNKAEQNLYTELIAGVMYAWDGKRVARAMEKISEHGGHKLSRETREKLETEMAAALERRTLQLRPDAERVFYVNAQRGIKSTAMTEIVGKTITLGLHMPDFMWLLSKTMGYQSSLGATYWTTPTVNELFTCHVKKWVKDKTLAELKDKDITELRDALPGALENLRDRDRKEVVKALTTGEPPKPLDPIWSYDHDVREELAE
jgi:predicted unusual protein kinase regulating ubiquinone biosynthesis (AarF/ABC1/UbiB family)